MANYDYQPLKIVAGIQLLPPPMGGVRAVLADIGGALGLALIENFNTGLAANSLETGVPSALVMAVPQGFRFRMQARFSDGSYPKTTGGTDWTKLEPGQIDPDGFYRIEVIDPAFTSSDPTPTLTDWSTKCGGTVTLP